jgi:hypothetical protein
MFDACEGCGGFPDHSINSPKCAQNRAEAVREAQRRADLAEKIDGKVEGYEDWQRGKYMVD